MKLQVTVKTFTNMSHSSLAVHLRTNPQSINQQSLYNLFSLYNYCHTISVHCLQSFDWSYNSLTSQGVEIVLRSMNTAAVTFLNLTGTVGSYTVNLIAKHLATYLTHVSIVLLYLE